MRNVSKAGALNEAAAAEGLKVNVVVLDVTHDSSVLADAAVRGLSLVAARVGARAQPREARLQDVAARGRSLGVILIGAQQNPSGVDRDITNNASLEVVGQMRSVSMSPGDTALTRTFWRANSRASVRVKPMSPAFEAA